MNSLTNKLGLPVGVVVIALAAVGYWAYESTRVVTLPQVPAINSTKDLDVAEQTLDQLNPEADAQAEAELDAELAEF